MSSEDTLLIRPFAEVSDYQSLASLYNYAYPEETLTPLELSLVDRFRDSGLTSRRWVAERGGAMKGVGGFEHWESFYHPHKYLLHIIVNPDDQRQGIGSALYDHVINEISKLRPQLARAWVSRDHASSLRFAETRGFMRERLKWNFSLNVQACDLRPYDEHLRMLHEDGVEIKKVADLAADPDRDRKLYELYVESVESIVAADVVQQPSYDEFVQKVASDPMLLHYTFVAERDGQYVGLWTLEQGTNGNFWGGVLGVRPAYRQSGVALGLLVHGIAQAKADGRPAIVAHTDEHNRAVLKLTARLGFVHLPAQILYVKNFDAAES